MNKQLVASIDRFARMYGCRNQLVRMAENESTRESLDNESEFDDIDGDPNICPECGEPYSIGESRIVYNEDESPSRRICDNCYNDGDYTSCDLCNRVYENSNIVRPPGGSEYCVNCNGEDTSDLHSIDLIHPYAYKPDMTVFHEDEGDEDKRHYGVELETILKKGDISDEAAHTLNILNNFEDNEDFAYLKEDPSLSKEVQANGYAGSFEIVTHPATLPIQKEHWKKFFQRRPSQLLGKDAESTGLHIHVERKDLGDLAIGKILAFVNSADNEDFITDIAGRRSDRYAELKPSKTVTDVRKSQRDRYEAINLQNKDTIEFRIFKGTMDKDEFMSRLEFVDALTSYIKSDLPSVREVMGKQGVDGLANYVSRNRKTYPHLHEFMKKNEYISSPSKEKMAKTMPVKIQHIPMRVSISYAYKHKDSAKPEHNIIYRLAQLKA